MEFLPGGDLMNLLIMKDILPEEQARFYIAELVVAVHTVHKKNYIHRYGNMIAGRYLLIPLPFTFLFGSHPSPLVL
jgi:hypothetical protein